MSSNVKKITDALEDRLQSIIPTFVKSIHTWSKPSGSPKAKYTYRIRPGESSTAPGTQRTITLNQKFSIFLEIHYKNDNDATLDAEVETLYASIELLISQALQKGFSIGRIIQISEAEATEIEVNHQDKLVTIGATFSVLYRME